MSKYITKAASIYFVDDLGNEKFIWECTALPNAVSICEIFNADLIKNGMYSIWEYKELVEKEQQITELEAKLAESEETINNLEQQCLICNKDKENEQLKQQLAEKDEEIEKLNDKLEWKSKWLKIAGNMVEHYEKSNQDKISFAVEQLIQAKEYIKKSLENMWNGNVVMTCRDRSIIDGIYTKLDEQIEELTHHHKDKGE